MEIPEIEDEDEVKSMISAAELVRVLSRRRYNHPFVVWSGLVWSGLAERGRAMALRMQTCIDFSATWCGPCK
jgi:thiol-disulfide isomerase/thioredoxin